MDGIVEEFWRLLRLGLGLEDINDTKSQLLHSSLFNITSHWASLLDLGRRQAVLGVLFAGAEKLPPELWPPKPLLMRWMQQVMLIRSANAKLTAMCAKLTELLAQRGLESMVLKGQGVADYYPDPMLRQCGDIDIFVRPVDAGDDAPEAYVGRVVQALRETGRGRVEHVTYHHAEWHLPEAEVEVHYRLSYFNTPWRDRRLWRWTLENLHLTVEKDGFFRPTDAVNAVYLMVHLYRHVLYEGIGLRQVMDYAMLLHRAEFTADERHRIAGAFNDLGMMRFARGMMWVVNEVFHIPPERLPVPMDAAEGRFLLDEIMRAGNFGRYDPLIDHRMSRSTAGRFWVRTRHRARFATRYTWEVLWDVPFRLKHWWWRRRHGV